GIRLLVLLVSVAVIIFGMPVIASIFALLPFPEGKDIANTLRSPALLAHITPIGIYVFGSSVGSLLTAVCAALMRMRLVLIIGGLTQLAVLCLGFVVLQLGWGTNGMLWLFAIVSLLNAAAFAIWQAPLLLSRNATFKQPLLPLLKLGISAWLTNLVTGALLKQISIILLGIFAVSLVDIGYFNLSFQLADSANMLLVAGFGGVAGSALAAAFVGNNHERFARSWQALIKVETLLAAPGLVFCLFNASNIAHALYGSKFDAVGQLFTIFLFFNILVRIAGTTIHQVALYVVNKARLVVLGQWLGMVILVILGVILIPRFGPAGALIADGVAKAITGFMLLFFLLNDLPRRYPLELLGFTLRFMLALVLAALPSILWHPNDRYLLIVSGVLFMLLCALLLYLIKPLSEGDLEMLRGTNPTVAKYLRWFARNRDKGPGISLVRPK
ncbi:MAG TPA: polysaccharide biosynthesis C-terminal domain-containing protein, partial [Ktedonobacteraceae bacterium]|nr:polysaccharide biosynthesis C-terminal domain-containing protein [Ktedonobacteraceae bacterium]